MCCVPTGTVTHYTVTHTGNGTEVMTFTTLDEFDPVANPFHWHFNFVSNQVLFYDSVVMFLFYNNFLKEFPPSGYS